jgi:hypothetical protein
MLLEYGVCRIPDKCLYVCIDSLLAVYQISNKRHFAIDLMRRVEYDKAFLGRTIEDA